MAYRLHWLVSLPKKGAVMKKQTTPVKTEKRLVVNRSRVRDLTDKQLEKVAGGCFPQPTGCYSNGSFGF
jgi:hypothetical protein